jgi:hypothetical protein
VYQVCDFVELNSDESGTTIRMHMALPSPNGEGSMAPPAPNGAA